MIKSRNNGPDFAATFGLLSGKVTNTLSASIGEVSVRAGEPVMMIWLAAGAPPEWASNRHVATSLRGLVAYTALRKDETVIEHAIGLTHEACTERLAADFDIFSQAVLPEQLPPSYVAYTMEAHRTLLPDRDLGKLMLVNFSLHQFA